jgi:uncharacterized protein (TIGR00369 family)
MAVRPSTPTEPASWGPARSKVLRWHDPRLLAEATATAGGLEILGAIRDGLLPPPPMAQVFGLVLVEVAEGRVVFEYEPDESAYNPLGMVHGGAVCTLADSVLGCAVHTTLGPGTSYTTVNLQVSFLRPLFAGRGVVRAVGTVTKPGRRVAFARAEITDPEGRLAAEATASCLILGP